MVNARKHSQVSFDALFTKIRLKEAEKSHFKKHQFTRICVLLDNLEYLDFDLGLLIISILETI